MKAKLVYLKTTHVLSKAQVTENDIIMRAMVREDIQARKEKREPKYKSAPLEAPVTHTGPFEEDMLTHWVEKQRANSTGDNLIWTIIEKKELPEGFKDNNILLDED